jgi:hypothetical protein
MRRRLDLTRRFGIGAIKLSTAVVADVILTGIARTWQP